jgi:hypothetical protein
MTNYERRKLNALETISSNIWWVSFWLFLILAGLGGIGQQISNVHGKLISIHADISKSK